MKPKEVLTLELNKIAAEYGGGKFVVEHPAEKNFGDYATNIALIVFGKDRGESKSPREVAERIVEELKGNKKLGEMFDLNRIEIAGPGFINFWLKESWLKDEMIRVVDVKGDYGRGEWGKGKRVLVEYSSPNIAKRFSVGHFRSTVIGQAIRNLYEFSGFETVGDNHLGDWGTQFGMIIVGIEERGLDVLKMSIDDLEELYVEMNKAAKEDETIRDKARDAFMRLEQGDEKAREIWKGSMETSMREFDKIYERLGVSIENAYGESAYEQIMPGVIEEAKVEGVAVKSQGAWIVEFEDMSPAMLVKSNGTTTYFTRDLATIKFRNESKELKSDLYIYEVGEEQRLHFRQVFVAAEKMGWNKQEDFVHVAHGLILGEDGKKMSTRKGTVVKVEGLIEEAVSRAREINHESSEVVGIGALKFFDLKHRPGTSYIFDWNEALALEGNSGPYVQYAVVRSKSVLEGVEVAREGIGEDYAMNKEELKVLRLLYQFGEVVEDAAKSFSPNVVSSYLYELAAAFNGFYNQHRILQAESEEAKAFRLMLTAASAWILERGLMLLGIGVPEKM